jgi:hypothetical protein
MRPYGDCIENVLAGVCTQCGERFFAAEMAKQMEAAVQQPRGPVPTIPVPVIAVK